MTAGERSAIAPVDGRGQRRQRNRAAVVQALLDLYRDGELAPNADAIAARAGVSPRSLFRYFDDIDALVEEAVRQQQARLAGRLQTDIDPDQAFDRRVDQLVALRMDLYEAMGPVARVARSLAAHQPRVAAELARIRSTLREQLAAAFAPELRARRGPAGERALATADVLSSWEAVDLLRTDRGMTADEAAATVAAGLRAVLG